MLGCQDFCGYCDWTFHAVRRVVLMKRRGDRGNYERFLGCHFGQSVVRPPMRCGQDQRYRLGKEQIGPKRACYVGVRW